MAFQLQPLSSGVLANVDRWSAADEGWRGYRTVNGCHQLTERITNALAMVTPTPGGTMLDIGCANGVLTGYFAERAQVASVLGADVVDLDPPFALSQVNLDGQEPLPFADRSFDVVICLETIEHVHDTDHLAGRFAASSSPEATRSFQCRGWIAGSISACSPWAISHRRWNARSDTATVLLTPALGPRVMSHTLLGDPWSSGSARMDSLWIAGLRRESTRCGGIPSLRRHPCGKPCPSG